MLDNITCNGHRKRIDKNFHRSRAKEFFFHYAKTFELDTQTCKEKKIITRMRENFFPLCKTPVVFFISLSCFSPQVKVDRKHYVQYIFFEDIVINIIIIIIILIINIDEAMGKYI